MNVGCQPIFGYQCQIKNRQCLVTEATEAHFFFAGIEFDRTDMEVNKYVTGFEFVYTGIVFETNSNPVCRTRFLRKKVSLRGFRTGVRKYPFMSPLSV